MTSRERQVGQCEGASAGSGSRISLIWERISAIYDRDDWLAATHPSPIEPRSAVRRPLRRRAATIMIVVKVTLRARISIAGCSVVSTLVSSSAGVAGEDQERNSSITLAGGTMVARIGLIALCIAVQQQLPTNSLK